MTKRISLHLAFWLCYLLQDMLLVVTWYGPAIGPIPTGKLYWIAFQASWTTIVPKVILTYYLLEVSLKQFQKERLSIPKIVAGIAVMFALCIFLYRAVSYYYVFPHVYDNIIRQSKLLEVQTVIVALIDIGYIAGLALAIKLIRIQLHAKEREKNLVKEKLETELKFLRNQINPHFLLNTLNNIYALARKKSEDTEEAVLRLSELLQFMLYESGGKFIKLNDEVKLIEGYLELELMRYSERLTVSFQKETDQTNYHVAPLLLLPFVENAFKHGVSETRFESFINISLTVKNGILHFFIENSNENKKSDIVKMNIGLNNVKRQLELSYKDYKLDLKNEENIFTVDLVLNLESYDEI